MREIKKVIFLKRIVKKNNSWLVKQLLSMSANDARMTGGRRVKKGDIIEIYIRSAK